MTAPMTDREMLEYAAKAAGVTTHGWVEGSQGRGPSLALLPVPVNGFPTWNPLTNDGDALRLAVRLALVVQIQHHECEVFDDEGECLSSVHIMSHPAHAYEATRAAITRAAAEIERSKSDGN